MARADKATIISRTSGHSSGSRGNGDEALTQNHGILLRHDEIVGIVLQHTRQEDLQSSFGQTIVVRGTLGQVANRTNDEPKMTGCRISLTPFKNTLTSSDSSHDHDTSDNQHHHGLEQRQPLQPLTQRRHESTHGYVLLRER